MDSDIRQQIVISGVGGQGVLFITRLLADAAIDKGLAVFTSETHGMAQRGGTVISYLKVGGFSSPLIRPGRADGMIALKAESAALHGHYLKPGGWTVFNSADAVTCGEAPVCVDADAAAGRLGNPKAANLVLLGAMLRRIDGLFCGLDDVKAVLGRRLDEKPELLAKNLEALNAGV